MLTPRPSKWAFGAIVVVLGVAAACSGSGGGPSVPTVSTPTVLTTSPPDGAVEVEPTAEVLLDIALPEGGSPIGDMTVHDGGNRLDGELVPLGGIRWRWQPVGQLPRGNTLEIRSKSQGRVASFTVREANSERRYELPGLVGRRVYVWPNGRAAIATDDRWFEITDDGLVERFVQMPSNIGAYGDGQAVFYEDDPANGVRWCVRSGLDGERDRTLAPPTGAGFDVNARGDFVQLVYGNHPVPSERGLWVLRNDSSVWELAGPTEVGFPQVSWAWPHIEDSGAVSIVSEGLEPELRRFVPGNLVPEVTRLPLGLSYTWTTHEADGSGWVLWVEANDFDPSVLFGARYTPGVGLGDKVPLYTWPDHFVLPLLAFEPPAISARGGSAVVRVGVRRLTFGLPIITGTDFVYLRVEADGWTSEPVFYSGQLPSMTGFVSMQARAELLTASAFGWGRSRPGQETVQIDDPIGPVDPLWTLMQQPVADDSGRLFAVYTEALPGGPVTATHIVVIE